MVRDELHKDLIEYDTKTKDGKYFPLDSAHYLQLVFIGNKGEKEEETYVKRHTLRIALTDKQVDKINDWLYGKTNLKSGEGYAILAEPWPSSNMLIVMRVYKEEHDYIAKYLTRCGFKDNNIQRTIEEV